MRNPSHWVPKQTGSLVRVAQKLALGTAVLCAVPALLSCVAQQTAPVTSTTGTEAVPAGALVPAATLQGLLPASVYFQGKTAPLELRNAAAFKLDRTSLLWVGLVDSSGYASDVQEKYQFYLVTEAPLRFGSAKLTAGAYGGGFVGEQFLLMDLGGHTLATGSVQSDAALRRPRPLQLVPGSGDGARLYLGRRWVLLQPDTASVAK